LVLVGWIGYIYGRERAIGNLRDELRECASHERPMHNLINECAERLGSCHLLVEQCCQ
jgi:hypothetical protein